MTSHVAQPRRSNIIALCTALLLCAAIAPLANAANVTTQSSTGGFTVDTTHDLLIGPTFGTAAYTGTWAPGLSDPTDKTYADASTTNVLYDGSFGAISPTTGKSTVAPISTGNTITYAFNMSLNPLGYNLGEIDTYGGWNDSGRDNQAYNVAYQAVGSSTFVDIAGAISFDPNLAGPSNTFVRITELNLAGIAVQAVKFTFNTQNNGYSGYREIVIKGTPVVVTTQNGTGTFPVTVTNDLLIGSTLAGATYTGSYTYTGVDAPYANASTTTVLYDGNFGTATPATDPTTVAPIRTGSTITYAFNTAASPLGFNLSEIDVFGGWNDNGRDNQAYTVSYQALGGSTFVEIATLSFSPTVAGGTVSNTAVTIKNLGISNVAVQVVQFTFGNQLNGYSGYREIVIQGTAVPVPTATWTGVTSSDWGDPTNWSPNGVPSPNAVLTFGSAGANAAVDLRTSSQTAAGITFLSNVSTTIGSSGGNSLTLNNVTLGVAPVGVSGTHAITAQVVLNTNTSFNVASGGQITDSGIISESTAGRALSMSGGSGLLILSGANTYTGPTNISSGTVQANVAQNGTTSGPFGTNGTITFGGGTLQYSSLNQVDYSPRFATTLQTISVDTNGQAVTFATALLGSTAGGLTLLDSAATKGSLTLSGANAFTGPITVNNGTLKAGSGTALGVAASR